jgi:hypothetical protein
METNGGFLWTRYWNFRFCLLRGIPGSGVESFKSPHPLLQIISHSSFVVISHIIISYVIKRSVVKQAKDQSLKIPLNLVFRTPKDHFRDLFVSTLPLSHSDTNFVLETLTDHCATRYECHAAVRLLILIILCFSDHCQHGRNAKFWATERMVCNS